MKGRGFYSGVAALVMAMPMVPQSRARPADSPTKVRWTGFKPGEINRLHPPRPDQSPAIVDPLDNRLVFTQKDIHLWVTANAASARNAFTICGLLNPEIQLPAHARLTITLLNLEYFGAPVRLAIIPQGPPFPTRVTINEAPAFRRLYRLETGRLAPVVAPSGPDFIYTGSFVFEIGDPGTAWYVNPIPGAANMGFYGKIVVVP